MPAYKKVLLKLSGEALMGDDSYGINPATIDAMVTDIAWLVPFGDAVTGCYSRGRCP